MKMAKTFTASFVVLVGLLMATRQPLLGGEQTPASDRASTSATYFSSVQVAEAFAKGGTPPLLFDGKSNYQVLTVPHNKGGMAEVHALDTDIDYVVEGSATYVTGGTVVNPKTVGDETRGTAIEGGETHLLSKGDVIIVPKGVPHWFKEVHSPFRHFMVKVR
jgi:glc operon protein GlcG